MDISDRVNGTGIITLYKFKVTDTEAKTLEKIKNGKLNPYETITANNTWLTSGWTELLKNATGTSANHWNAANTVIGVGDNATAASAAQTDLIAATNKVYKALESGYPTAPASGLVQFKCVFLTTEANFTHAELVVKNTASNVCWNRNATGWGAKTSSDIWYYLVTLGKA